MTRRQFYKLVVLTLNIQEKTNAYTALELSGVSNNVCVYVMDNGFESGRDFDGFYRLSVGEEDKETYTACVRHLERLLHNNSPVPDESNGAKENKSLS